MQPSIIPDADPRHGHAVHDIEKAGGLEYEEKKSLKTKQPDMGSPKPSIKMPRNFFTNILLITAGFFLSDIINNARNPIRLATGIIGYHIQSQILHTPDCNGFFSPGLRLQKSMARSFIYLAILPCYSIVFDGFIILLERLCGLPFFSKVGRLIVEMAITEAVVTCIWWLWASVHHRNMTGETGSCERIGS
jgi:hypothetical protein